MLVLTPSRSAAIIASDPFSTRHFRLWTIGAEVADVTNIVIIAIFLVSISNQRTIIVFVWVELAVTVGVGGDPVSVDVVFTIAFRYASPCALLGGFSARIALHEVRVADIACTIGINVTLVIVEDIWTVVAGIGHAVFIHNGLVDASASAMRRGVADIAELITIGVRLVFIVILRTIITGITVAITIAIGLAGV